MSHETTEIRWVFKTTDLLFHCQQQFKNRHRKKTPPIMNQEKPTTMHANTTLTYQNCITNCWLCFWTAILTGKHKPTKTKDTMCRTHPQSISKQQLHVDIYPEACWNVTSRQLRGVSASFGILRLRYYPPEEINHITNYYMCGFYK